ERGQRGPELATTPRLRVCDLGHRGEDRRRHEMGDLRLRSDSSGEERATEHEGYREGETGEDRAARDGRRGLRTARGLGVVEWLVEDLEVEAVGRLQDARHHIRLIDA